MRNVLAITLLLAATTGVSASGDAPVPTLYDAVPMLVSATGAEVPTLVGGDRDAHGCIGSAGYSWDEDNAKCDRVWEREAEFGKPLPPTAKHYNRHGARFDLNVRYPKTGVAALDAVVIGTLRNGLADFKGQISEMPAKDVWDGKYQMFADFEKTSYRGLASVTLSDYRFTGGAHGNTDYNNYDVDLKTGKILEDADIFKDVTAAKKKIAGLVYAKLVSEAPDRIYSDRNEAKQSLNNVGGLKVLRFTKGGLEFQSTPYQVGPYAAGVVKVTVPYADVMDMFTDNVADRLK